MKSRCAVAVVVLSLAVATLAADAQRGAAPHAGMAAPSGEGARGGFAPSAHAGFAPSAARGGLAPAARFGSVAGARSAAGQRNLFPPPGITSTRPVSYSNGIRRYGEAGGRQRYGGAGYGGVGYGLIGYGYPGYLDFGYPGEDALDPLDPNNNINSGTSAQDAFINAPSTPGYGPDPNTGAPPAYAAESEGAAQPTPYVEPPASPASYAPARRPQPAPLPEEDAVTIVFKDGRPSEQIHNYALTRTTLYITTGRVRAVPVEDIDLPATEKANQKAGVEFQLPTK